MNSLCVPYFSLSPAVLSKNSNKSLHTLTISVSGRVTIINKIVNPWTWNEINAGSGSGRQHEVQQWPINKLAATQFNSSQSFTISSIQARSLRRRFATVWWVCASQNVTSRELFANSTEVAGRILTRWCLGYHCPTLPRKSAYRNCGGYRYARRVSVSSFLAKLNYTQVLELPM